MAIYQVTKDKNILTLINQDTENEYFFNINTGILNNAKGRELKNYPSGFATYARNCLYDEDNSVYVRYFGYIYSRYAIQQMTHFINNDKNILGDLQTIDKLVSLGVKPQQFTVSSFRDSLTFIEENFKEFAKFYTENIDQEDCLDKFYEQKRYEILKKKCQSNDLTDKQYRFIFQIYDNLSDRVSLDEYLPIIAYWVKRGCDIFFDTFPGDFCDKIKEMLKYSKELNIEIKKDDFFRQYIDLCKTYFTYKEQIDNTALLKIYEEKANLLTYSNDNFTVILPKTTQEFMDEATQQNNCVFNYYLSKCVEEETYVVFIRKNNSLDKSYITCEVAKNGNIKQYLLAYNNCPREQEDLDFRKEYQKYLLKHWEIK